MFVVGRLEFVGVVPFVVSVDKGRGNERRIKADPKEKNRTENPVSMMRRDSWRYILVE